MVIDAISGEALPFVSIKISVDDILLVGTTSDFDGHYNIKIPLQDIDAKQLVIRYSYVGYHEVVIRELPITGHDLEVSLKMEESALIGDVVIIRAPDSKIEMKPLSSGSSYSKEEIRNSPYR